MKLRDKRIRRKNSSRVGEPASEGVEQTGKGIGTSRVAVMRAWARRDTISLILILLAAAVFRFLNLNYMEFKADEAGYCFLAASLASGKTFPLVGIPSSIGTLNPPFFIYLMGIPLLFSRNPVIAAGFVALLNCAAVGLCYVFCRRYFGQIAAIVAAVFFAVNPWAVLYNRKIWQSDVLPLFVIGFFFSLFAVVCEGRKKHLLTCFACLAATMQLHLSSVYFLVVLVLILLWFRPKVGWGIYLGGFAVAFLFYVPYVLFDLLNRGFNAKIYLHTLSSHSRFHLDAAIAPFQLASTLGFMHFVNLLPLDMIQNIFLTFGLVYLFFRRSDPRYAILFAWFFIPWGFFLMSKTEIYPHYFLCLYPVQFIAVGIAAKELMQDRQSRSKILPYATPALLSVLIAYQLSSSVKFVTSIAGHEPFAWMTYSPGYGPPFRFRVEEIRDLAQKGIVDPEAVQKAIVQSKPPNIAVYYDFPSTKYIVENLNALPRDWACSSCTTAHKDHAAIVPQPLP